MRAGIALASTVCLVVVCSMVAAALTDTMGAGGTGEQWRTLLRVSVLASYAGGVLFGVGGLALAIRYALSR